MTKNTIQNHIILKAGIQPSSFKMTLFLTYPGPVLYRLWLPQIAPASFLARWLVSLQRFFLKKKHILIKLFPSVYFFYSQRQEHHQVDNQSTREMSGSFLNLVEVGLENKDKKIILILMYFHRGTWSHNVVQVVTYRTPQKNKTEQRVVAEIRKLVFGKKSSSSANIYQDWDSILTIIVIGLESDHCLPLSLTDWLSD